MMERWRDKVAIVTGASSGIGAAVATALVHHGVTVGGLARRLDNMQRLSSELKAAGEPGTLHGLKTDLRKEEDILSAFSWVEDNLGGADIIVNNAGVLDYKKILDGQTETWRAMFEVNVLAVAVCMREFVKSMERRNNQDGHIFVINSVAGHQAEFLQAGVYCGSKFAITAITKCLRKELAEKKSRIKVTSVSPGATETEIYAGTDFAEKAKHIFLLQPEDVSAVVIDALSTSSVSQICEIVLTPIPTQHAVY